MKPSKLSIVALLASVLCVAHGRNLRAPDSNAGGAVDEIMIPESEATAIEVPVPEENEEHDGEPVDPPADGVEVTEISELESEDGGRRLAGGKGSHNIYVENHCWRYSYLRVSLKFVYRKNEYYSSMRTKYGYRYYYGYTDQRNIRWNAGGGWKKTRMPKGKKGNYILKITC